MLYRKMNRVASDLSILGFGCMRLPEDGRGHLDEGVATQMLHHAIEHGVNFVDTAYPYHNGESEPFLGRALEGGYRERVMLETKLPSWLINSREDMDRYLDLQLKRLRTDHLDFYLVHGLMAPFWEKLSKLGVCDFLDDALADGRIRHAGFSFHDELPVFKQIVDAYDWTVCLLQYNFFDEHSQAGLEGLDYASKKGLGVAVMEPLRGGMLTKQIPSIDRIWSRSGAKRSLSERALLWVWNHPQVTVVLSGMSSMSQLTENLAYADGGIVGSLPPQELELYRQVKEEYERRIRVPCTGCRYCMPCPAGVGIPECFEYYNQGCIFDSPEIAALNYRIVLGGMLSGKEGYAIQCLECGQCEEHCPQGIAIREKLKEVAMYFGKC